jgi:hypothetical protein
VCEKGGREVKFWYLGQPILRFGKRGGLILFEMRVLDATVWSLESGNENTLMVTF